MKKSWKGYSGSEYLGGKAHPFERSMARAPKVDALKGKEFKYLGKFADSKFLKMGHNFSSRGLAALSQGFSGIAQNIGNWINLKAVRDEGTTKEKPTPEPAPVQEGPKFGESSLKQEFSVKGVGGTPIDSQGRLKKLRFGGNE